MKFTDNNFPIEVKNNSWRGPEGLKSGSFGQPHFFAVADLHFFVLLFSDFEDEMPFKLVKITNHATRVFLVCVICV